MQKKRNRQKERRIFLSCLVQGTFKHRLRFSYKYCYSPSLGSVASFSCSAYLDHCDILVMHGNMLNVLASPHSIDIPYTDAQ